MNNPISEKSIKRAKIILEKIGYVTARIKERDQARLQLHNHLEKLSETSNEKKINRLKLLMENVFNKEANLVKSNFYESEKVKELKEVIRKLTADHRKALDSLEYMKIHNKEYLKLKKIQEKRENILEKKMAVKMNSKIKDKLDVLENKYFEYKTSGKLPESKLKDLKIRIEKMKASLL